MKRSTLRVVFFLLLAVALVLSGCGSDDTGGAAAGEGTTVEESTSEEGSSLDELLEEGESGAGDEMLLPAVDPGSVSGDITIAGSSTVFPLTEAMAERFADEGYSDEITVASIGSGAGFERFCVEAETDISNASRAIRESEVEDCEANGREPLEFRVGTDALAITVSQANDFVDNLSLEQLAQIFSGEVATWAELDSAWPDEAIELFSPGTDSGTFDYFVEAVLDEDEEAILSVDGVQYSEDDNVLVQGIEGSASAIGYFGYAYYLENQDKLRVLSVDGIEPTGETAEDGSYPLSRPLFIYSAPSILQEKPQVAAFINFYLTYVNDEVVEVGYFPASVQALDSARELWLDAAQ